jgi:hypothetical protein
VDKILETESEQSCAFCEIDCDMRSVLLESDNFYVTMRGDVVSEWI